MKRALLGAALAGIALLVGASANAQAPRAGVGAAAPCDRACLGAHLDRYLAAVFKHDPKAAGLAANHKATFDGAAFPPGTGVWQKTLKYGHVERRFFDPQTGGAAYFGDLIVDTTPTMASIRIKVERGQITEAEWTIGTQENSPRLFDAEGLAHDPPPLTIPLAAKDRVPREQMVAAANAYFQGINDHSSANIPHIVGCQRLENGTKVTFRERMALTGIAAGVGGAASVTGGCTDGLEGFATRIINVNNRRFPLVDEEVGVVMGTTIFHRPPSSTEKRNLLTEYFYTRGGKIAGIYAAMWYMDPDAPDHPGW